MRLDSRQAAHANQLEKEMQGPSQTGQSIFIISKQTSSVQIVHPLVSQSPTSDNDTATYMVCTPESLATSNDHCSSPAASTFSSVLRLQFDRGRLLTLRQDSESARRVLSYLILKYGNILKASLLVVTPHEL